MRAKTRSPESMPRVNPHLKTRTTGTSFAQNNIKSGSPDTYLPHAQDRAHIPVTKGTLPKNIESNFNHFTSSTTNYYKLNLGGSKSENKMVQHFHTNLGLTNDINET